MGSETLKHRSHLPMPDPPLTGLVTYDAKDPDTKFPPIEELRPPKGAPNVLIVLLDDVGFGASSAFGGPVHTPTAERLAANGLIDGQKVGEGRVDETEPFGYAADETCDVGVETGSPVSPEYGPRGNAFTGEVSWVEIDVDRAALDADHVLTDVERLRVAMALQ